MHVLLTGGAGFIGRHVLASLTASGHEVRVLDSLRPDVHRDGRTGGRGLPDLRVADVRDRGAVDAALDGVDAVVHLAAKVGLGVAIDDLPDYADSNVHGTAVLLAAMAQAGVRRLVQASSMVVYGEGLARCAEHGAVRPAPRRETDLAAGRFEPPCPHCGRFLEPALVTEDAVTDPRNAYAVSKLGQEQLAEVWSRTTGSAVTSLRYHNVYGPGLPRDTPYAGVAAIFLSSLRRGEPPRVHEDGAQRRDFVHVRDVAAATVAALDHQGDGAQVFNIGSGTPRTVGDLALALSSAVHGPEPVVTGDYRLGDVRHVTADSTRARTALAWEARVGFAEGVGELAHD
ncbi:MAG: NAD-dependent epimerase/dehydratase family protein [Jatrophihabitans sp.]|uniref:NAD-dependent epimerase/dehydratase family protein n=1 Tax=Jatrophihabitans sp. TaxID=1932789 RepID=UPI003F80F2EA